ncbi:MAG: peptidoglycan binding domain-containing protein, partial [Polyangiaceae bacterium]|nr:peptidoglycan binding domain-containing protein [Polyangiaceae bacterium]
MRKLIWQSSTIFALCLFAGSALALLILPRAPRPNRLAQEAFVSLAGQDFPLDKNAEERATAAVGDWLRQPFSLRLPDGSYEALNLSDYGATLDNARLEILLRDARDPQSALRSHQEEAWSMKEKQNKERTSPLALRLELPIIIDRKAATKQLLGLKEIIDRAPRDARLDVQTGKIKEDQSGWSLDIDGTLERIEEAAQQGQRESQAALIETKPRRKADELKDVDIDNVLGHFSTRYSQARKDRDRTFNLQLAASRLDGTVLLPGEVFDF